MAGLVLACVVGILLLRTDFADGQSCTDLQSFELSLKFCNPFQAAVSTIYLDSHDIDTRGIGECTCTISANGQNLTNINISNVPMSEPGGFELVVGGKKVELPVMVNYQSPMNITIRKPQLVPVKQCMKVTAEFGVNSTRLFTITCFTRQPIVPTTHSIVPTTQPIVPTSPAPAEPADSSGEDGSNTGVIAGATVGGLVVIIAGVLVVVIIIRRKRNGSSSKDKPRTTNHGGKDVDYDMTVHDGYVSADANNAPAKREQPSVQTYEDIDDIKQGPSGNNKGRKETNYEKQTIPSGHYDYAEAARGNIHIKDVSSSSKPYDDLDNNDDTSTRSTSTKHDAMSSTKPYEDVGNTDNVRTTFSPTKHDEMGYTIVDKPAKVYDTEVGNVEDENEYSVINAKEVVPPTGNIYGVALPIQSESTTD